MHTVTGRHAAPRAYPSARRIMRITGYAVLGLVSLAGYWLAFTVKPPLP